ncbi:MAG TPA: flagellar biosynthesis protein FlhF, partial [Accumulibacter sp.]|uniref:flagellar biosynthesis protein FlhF n=1 Tax=Accumulibacter sp. TaxID=2053492 RepID=UPI002CA067F2
VKASEPASPPPLRPSAPLAARPMPQVEPQRPQPRGAVPAEVVPAAVMDEIRSLRRMVERQLAGFAWGESTRAAPVKTEMLRQMLDAGFSPQFARELLADLPHDLDAGNALAWVKGGADRGMLTISSETDIVDRGGIYALVGPTGVGKTTTTAKLAARCVLRHGARKLALVTTDGYRIGAHEQLRIYGRILGVSVHLAKDADDLRATLKDLRHTHMVLIDTMGMSQRDRLVSEQVAMFGDNDVKSLLLLSATSRGDTLDDVVRAYSGLQHLAGCILTKVDEAASLASSLDVIIRHRLRLYYVSNGQRVPEDLHLPNRPYLLHRAFKDLPESSPHRLDGVEPGLLMASAACTTPSGNISAGGHRG